MNADSAQDIQDIYPLSGMQQLLLMHGLQPGGADSGFLHYRCIFHGALDTAVLRTAWGMVAERCDILRASFAWDGFDEPLQVVHRTVELPWTQLDWTAHSESEQASRLGQLVEDDRAQGFDFGSVPLTRLTLIRLADNRHAMLWSHHHLQTDGWSVAVIIREVLSCYAALRQGAVPVLEPRRPFRDYISWLKERDQGAAQRYWSGLLRGFTSPTRLAASAPGPAATGGAPGPERVRLSSPAAVMRGLELRASSCHVTLNALVSAAWALVLGRTGGSADVVFGSTVSGRPPGLAGVENMVGTFINNLPVRIQIQPQQRLADWLDGIFRQQISSQEFDFPPLYLIEEWSDIPARARLFDSLVLFDNTPDTTAIACGPDLRIDGTDGSLTSSFPFTLLVRCREQLELEAIVDPRRITVAAAALTLTHLAAILARLGDPDITTVAELEQVLDAGATAAAGMQAEAGDHAVPGRQGRSPAAAQEGSARSASAGRAHEQPERRLPYIPLHTQLLGLWESLLGVKDIAISDSFFALGGHSLLAARMLNEAGRLLGRPVPITLLFEGPTIEQLAAAMLREFAPQHRPLIELTPGNGDPPYFFLHGDLVGGGYYTVKLARLLGGQVPFQVLAPLPVASGQAPPTVEEMAAEHVTLIRGAQPHGPYRLGGYCNGGVVMFEAARQLIQAGERVEFLGLIDATVGARWLDLISHAIEKIAPALGLSIDQQLRLFAYLDNRLGRLADPDELRKVVRTLFTRWHSPRPERRSAGVEDAEGGIRLRAYLWALARYRPQRIPGTLTLYMADNGNHRHLDQAQDWEGYADRIEIRALPGQHFDIITHQVERLAAELLKDMTRPAQATRVG